MPQYSDDVLDDLTSPKLTLLTACEASEVPELPHYDAVLKMNQVLGPVKYKNDNDRVLLMMFISRFKTAISEYNRGRIFLQRYVDALPANHFLEEHRKALAHFENCILQLHVAIVSLASLGGGIKPGRAKSGWKQLYVIGDGSDYDRLRLLNNSIKHFDEIIDDAVKSNASVPIAPVWITNDGFECTKGARLSFLEIETIFEAQAKDAENFSSMR